VKGQFLRQSKSLNSRNGNNTQLLALIVLRRGEGGIATLNKNDKKSDQLSDQ
jgi:hypothetical protein